MPMLLHLLVPLARPFRARYPQLELELLSSEGYINLIERRVDVAIRAFVDFLRERLGPAASLQT